MPTEDIFAEVPTDWNWTIDGDTVYVDNDWVYLSATPHTLADSGWVEFELESKVLSGEIDSIWGFNSTKSKPRTPQIWRNYSHEMSGYRWMEKFKNDTFTNTISYDVLDIDDYDNYDDVIGNKNNSKLWNLTYNSYNDIVDEWYLINVTIAFTSKTLINETIIQFFYYEDVLETYYYDKTFFDWKSFDNEITVKDKEWNGFNKWYMVSATIQEDKVYRVRVWIEIPFGGLEGVSGEYVWALKETSKTIQQAIDSGRFLYLDPWWNASWLYCKEITIEANYVGSDLTDFPILFKNTSSDFALHAQPDGDDFAFVNATNVTQFNHEIERYNSTTGELIAWVNITELSSATDTTLWIYYGNAGAANQENVSGTWDDNFLVVYHLNESGGNAIDSTANGNDGTYHGDLPDRVAGKIDYGQDFDGTGDYISLPAGAFVDTDATFECWIEQDGTSVEAILWHNENAATTGFIRFFLKAGGNQYSFESNTGMAILAGTQTTNFDKMSGVYDTNDGELRKDTVSLGIDNTVTPVIWVYGNVDIGSYKGTGFYIDGVLEEARISDVRRSNNWLDVSFYSQNQTTGFMIIGDEQTGAAPPVQSGEVPASGSTGIITIPDLYVNCTDPNGDNMTADWWSNSSGSWVQFATNSSFPSGTNITQTNSNFSVNKTTYYWSVNLTDGVHWTNTTYHFTTAANTPPIQSGEVPANGSINTTIIPVLYVFCNDTNDDTMNASWWSNSSGSWVEFASNSSFVNNTNITQTNSNFSGYSTTYYWSVNLSDGTEWTNETYHFTTEANTPPIQSGEVPANGSVNVSLQPDLYVLCNDDDTMNATWWSNSSGSWVQFASNSSFVNNTNITQTNSNFSNYSTTYYWSVNLTDGTDWVNETYHFTILSPTTSLRITARRNVVDLISIANDILTVVGIVLIIGAIMVIVFIVKYY